MPFAGSAAGFNEEDDADLEAMPPALQASLLTAWQGLVGSAVHMVKSMQAARWDRSNNSTIGISGSSTAAAGAGESAANRSGRLQLLCDRLSSALDPSVAADGDAAAVLQDIEQLAEQAVAAGNEAEKLARVLEGQGIVITIGCPDSSFSSSKDSQMGDLGTGRTRSTDAAAAGCSSKCAVPASAVDVSLNVERPAAAAQHPFVGSAATLADTADDVDASDAQAIVQRSSVNMSLEESVSVDKSSMETSLAAKVCMWNSTPMTD